MENKLSYVNYDYDELVQQLTDRLKAKDDGTSSWKDVNESGTGKMLIELFAFVSNLVLYYLERRAEECYLKTAQNKSSIVSLVQLLNYSPKRNVSAKGTVQFSIASSVLGRVYIDQFTEMSTAGGITFVTTSQGTIEIGSTNSNLITAIQGTVKEQSISSTGLLNLEIPIESVVVENNTHDDIDTFEVFVNGRKWTQVSSFFDSTNSDEHFILRTEMDDTVTVVFGDNRRGKAPESGTILIRYILSDGTSGNVYETDKITTVVSPSISYSYRDGDDVLQDGTVTLSVTNTTTMVGGDDAEDIEEIRNEAPDVFKTGDRLVTKEDFAAFLYNYPSIAEARVWGEYEDETGGFVMFNVVNIVVLLNEWYDPSTLLKQDIEDSIREKSMLTVRYTWITAEIFEVVVCIDVVVNKRYGLSATQAEIETLMISQFELGKTALFAQNKRLSNLIEKVDALDSVDYHHMILEVREVLTTEYSSGMYGIVLQSETVKSETCRLFVGTTHVATDVDRNDDSGLGDLVSIVSGYDIVGTINYTTLEVLVDIDPAPSSVVSVQYQQDVEGDVLVGNNGICKLYKTDITSIVYSS